MRLEEITVETIDVEAPNIHHDASPYETILVRVLPADHPNSFTVPISVNLNQFGAHHAQAHARFVFHRLMGALAQATTPWDRADGESSGDAAPVAASATNARLGPAADPAEGKR